MTDLPKDIESELAALADGSLTGEHREEARARVRHSRELQAALAEQRCIVALTGAVRTEAPESLHHEIGAMLVASARRSRIGPRALGRDPKTARARGRSERWRGLAGLRVGLPAIAVVAAIAVLAAVGLSGGSHSSKPSPLSVGQASILALGPATEPAPGESRQHRSELTVAVGGVAFPYWGERFGWHSSGTRKDLLAGRTVTTVFYTDHAGRRVGYAIASGPAPKTSGGRVVRRWGVSYRLLRQDGATVVSWQRDGHLCVMASHGVSAATLLELAGWGGEKPRAA